MPKVKPEEIWSEYEKGNDYLNRNDLFETVRTNEDFYEGKQWGGLNNGSMPTPVFNVLQRAGKWMVATIGSNDIAISMIPFSELADDIQRMQPISQEIENIIEIAKIKEASKLVIRNAFVDGSGFMMQSFNPNFETMQDVKGRVENQVIDNTNVIFGNPYSRDIQGQPYIIVTLRQHISQVKEEARRLGVSKENIELINAENDHLQVNDDSDNLVTVLLKFYKDTKVVEEKKIIVNKLGLEQEVITKKEETSVWFTKTTKEVTLIQPTDLGYKRYPISCFGWDVIKNSYLYSSPMTSVIPNQVFINKSYAIAQMYGLQSAFPKILFDKSKVNIDDFLNSTSPQAVAGLDLAGKYMDFIKIPDFSNNILQLASDVISQTKDCLGVTDASLGNVKPDNTSAIVALQESSSVPLEIQKQNFFEFWEDTVRNILDIVACSYGKRQVMTEDNQLALVDFDMLKGLNYNLKVEIGNGAQFSEVAQIQTLDKIAQAGWIDPDVYMEAIPSKYIPQKAKLIESYRAKVAQLAQQGLPMETQSRGSTNADDVVPL
ncbi:MAG: hypothetical protein KBT03_06880 [Bacteroidales bacterium]|nr:hypothetical protein [Candidatus Scybalousia scybalohippi]